MFLCAVRRKEPAMMKKIAAAFLLLALVFALFATVTLEFIDKDKR